MAVEGATTARVLEAYVEEVLAPSLRVGRVVVKDNLGAHRPKRVRELIEDRGCELLCTCRPTLKNLLRRAAASSREALIGAIGAALSAVSAQDARGFFEHAGYRHTGQPL